MKISEIDRKDEELDQFDYISGEYIEKVDIFIDYSYALGEFIITFSNLDHEINIAIADIFADDAHYFGYLIIEKLSFVNKIDLFYKLYLGLAHHTSPKNKKMLQKIKADLMEINTFRNNIIHANWTTLTKDKFVRTKLSLATTTGWSSL